VRFVFGGHIVPPNIGSLLDHPLMSSPIHEMYIPQREGDVLEVTDRLKIRLFNNI